MLNYLWGGFILAGILTAAFTGNLHNVTTGVIEQSKEAVNTCIVMLGVLSMWTGFMNIAEKSGLTKKMTKGLMPFLHFLFPEIPRDNKAMEHIGNNVAANLLGLGWASTPAGLYAMEELDKLNCHRESASDMMCDFMIFNMSSLQIISVNMIAYRSQYHSSNPSEIIGAGLFATLISTIASVIFIFARRALAKRGHCK
ncbi:MAG: nucleoside recognition protein [Firmicutes bacterium]|nr:nucleoside recognition protein [Bacillota bacterium]MBQ9604041.1 nucleoside recognition protein [Bacillota bacterium]